MHLWSVVDPEVRSRGRKRGCLGREFWKFLCKNHAFWCKIFTCFKMHPVNRGGVGCRPLPHLYPPLLVVIVIMQLVFFVLNSDKVHHLDDILVKNPLRILRLKTACANHSTVYEKVRRI